MNNLSAIFFVHRLLQQRLEAIEINSLSMARFLCRWIPAGCPFNRQIKLGKRVIASIPPLCKLNPFYDQLVALRFKSLIYLAEKCDEDSSFCC